MSSIFGWIIDLLLPSGFDPHIHHFSDHQLLMWFIVIGNAIIAIAYFSIPFALFYFVSKRRDIVFNWIFYLFCAFIFLCGITHVVHIVMFWHPIYGLQAVLDFLTGMVSIGTAIVLWIIMPQLLRIPGVQEIKNKNIALEKEIQKRIQAEEEIRRLNEELEKRVIDRTRELERTQRQFNALYNSSIIGVILCDLKGNFYQVNDAFLSMLGYTREEFNDGVLAWDKIVPSQYQEREKESLIKMLEDGLFAPQGREYIRKDGNKVYVLIGGAVLDKETTETIAFVLDINERRQLEQRKDEFISIASHELRTPLTTLKGYVQLSKKLAQDHAEAKIYGVLNRANDSIVKLERLIADLLDVSKIQAGKLEYSFERVDLLSILKECISNVEHLSKSHTIIFTSSFSIDVHVDRMRIEQVINNLLANAIKYSPDATTVEVSMSRTNDEVIVAVKDFGVGISKEAQADLFQKFYRVEEHKSSFFGMGMGLYISSEIMKRHYGRLWVESDVGKGATFMMALPIKKTP